MSLARGCFVAIGIVVCWCGSLLAASVGYYRQPALFKDTIVFVAEGDLWRVGTAGGTAIRLTSHPADESMPAISPDGQTVAFVGHYEGPPDVYTMPLTGALPTRRTFRGVPISVVGWTPDGKILCDTGAFSTLPEAQLIELDISAKDAAATLTRIPLAQAANGVFDPTGKTLFFTRLPHQGSHTRLYQGGTAQNLWRFTFGESEAVPLTSGYSGASKDPMWWNGRVYFLSDRDGSMNIWSMKPDGTDLHQHTTHAGWDAASPSLSDGKIVYQLGADLHLFDIASSADKLIPISLESDLDQMREHWVEKPLQYVSSIHLSKDGSHVALVARGEVFVVPQKEGRLVKAAAKSGVRFRDARFLPDDKNLLALSDQTGETEFWKLPANGVGDPSQLTHGADVLREEGVPSPDGKYIAHHDKNQRLFILDVATGENRKIDQSPVNDFQDLKWSPDSKWLAYVAPLDNLFAQLRICEVTTGKVTNLTSDRYDSYSPAWSPDGKWLYFLSDRNLKSVVSSPWGSYEPQPFLDKKSEVFLIALRSTEVRSPFAAVDELHPEKPEEKESPAATKPAPTSEPSAATHPTSEPAVAATEIDLDGVQSRLIRAPIPPGNYSSLAVTDKAIFWLSKPADAEKSSLMSAEIARDNVEPKAVTGDVSGFELSQDRKKILLNKGAEGEVNLYLIDANPGPVDLAKKQLDLSHLSFSIIPREEWHAMFVDAWRMERDYFYDPHMHGLNWQSVRAKYEPLVDRVTTREELSDLLAQMVSELSALHIFVEGGDMRTGVDKIAPASLGAVLTRDPQAGGYRIDHIYKSDPDDPTLAGPLAKLDVNVKEGDVIRQINGTSTLDVPDIGDLLRQQAGRQVLLGVKPHDSKDRDVVVTPIGAGAATNLRYHEWEYTRRLKVEDAGKGQIGYVHLRAMEGGNFTEWARGFYPVWTRQGLIIDVRHNMGGNIDSWLIDRLLRKAWFYWSQRVGDFSHWNMQYAFRGHVVVLCDEWTSSDGEAFSEGVKRLKLGTVIGTRTWGGQIWLSFDNELVDRGIASAAEYGVYGPEGSWLIEGHGVDPDIVVDNLPHATFEGQDAQLAAAIQYLNDEIAKHPVKPVPPPKYPDKTFKKTQPLAKPAPAPPVR